MDILENQRTSGEMSIKEAKVLLGRLGTAERRAILSFLRCIYAGLAVDEARLASNKFLVQSGHAPVPADFSGGAK